MRRCQPRKPRLLCDPGILSILTGCSTACSFLRGWPVHAELAQEQNWHGDASRATPVTMVAVTRLCACLERSATELEVLACLKFLRHERGLRPGTRSGPRSFAWFKTVVADYFRKRRERDMAADPAAYTPTSSIAFSPGSEFDAMTDAF